MSVGDPIKRLPVSYIRYVGYKMLLIGKIQSCSPDKGTVESSLGTYMQFKASPPICDEKTHLNAKLFIVLNNL